MKVSRYSTEVHSYTLVEIFNVQVSYFVFDLNAGTDSSDVCGDSHKC